MRGTGVSKTKDALTIKVDGLEELEEALKQFTDKMQNKLITSALRAAAKPVVKDAKRRAHQTSAPSSGALAESIGLKVRKSHRRGGNITGLWVAPIRNQRKALLQYLSYYGIPLSGKNANSGIRHGHLVEFGHQKPFGGSVEPRAFLRPALEQNKGVVISIFKTTLRKRIDALVKKLNKQGKAKYG